MYLSPVVESNKSSAEGSSKSNVSRTVEKRVDWKQVRITRQSRHRRDKNRKQSICSDSETETSSTCGALALEDLCLSVPTPKKWSLPLPVVTRGSESDSTSSSWSARSADEATEDERSPIPSPSASTKSCEAIISEAQTSAEDVKAKWKRPKKISKAAETHKLQRMKTTNYGRCKICDTYVYFWGFQCSECELISHKKCLKKMTIMCAKSPLPPKSDIINLELSTIKDDVPVLLVKCTLEIERRSCLTPGIYRMTGVSSRVQKLLKSFESGPHLIDVTDCNPNDLCSVLKIFLRELKQPLITNDVYKEFIDIGRIYRHDSDIGTKSKELVQHLQTAVNKLNDKHRSTLSYLIHHLKRITNFHEHNNMCANNLGIIFAPTIFRPRDAVNDLYTEVFEAGPQARVIELLITYVNEVFGQNPQTFTFEFVE